MTYESQPSHIKQQYQPQGHQQSHGSPRQSDYNYPMTEPFSTHPTSSNSREHSHIPPVLQGNTPTPPLQKSPYIAPPLIPSLSHPSTTTTTRSHPQHQQPNYTPTHSYSPNQESDLFGPVEHLPHHQPEIGPTTREPKHQPQIGRTTPEHHPQREITSKPTSLPHRQPQISHTTPYRGQGRIVLQSSPASFGANHQSVSSTGAYMGELSHGSRLTNRAAVGVDENYHPGGQPGDGRLAGNYQSVRDAIGGDTMQFHIVGTFNPHGPKDGKDAYSEITGAYEGSVKNASTIGLTMNLDHYSGKVRVKTEEHRDGVHGDATELQWDPGSQGIKNMNDIPSWNHGNTPHTMYWVASNGNGHVKYDGYVTVGGQTYKMGSITDPDDGHGHVIDYTDGRNTFARSREENGGKNGTVATHVAADGTSGSTPWQPPSVSQDPQGGGYDYYYNDDYAYSDDNPANYYNDIYGFYDYED